ncbi:MAG: hypothetical protein JKY56_03405 [Kofleriaceae bacterium]|nr:hypothetical protein [Kofleriaceae bacterium]
MLEFVLRLDQDGRITRRWQSPCASLGAGLRTDIDTLAENIVLGERGIALLLAFLACRESGRDQIITGQIRSYGQVRNYSAQFLVLPNTDYVPSNTHYLLCFAEIGQQQPSQDEFCSVLITATDFLRSVAQKLHSQVLSLNGAGNPSYENTMITIDNAREELRRLSSLLHDWCDTPLR